MSATRSAVIRAELRRGWTYLPLAAVGWAGFLFLLVPIQLAAALTVGLAVLTWVVMTLPVAAVRLRTGRDMSALDPGAPLFWFGHLSVAALFVALPLVVVFDYPDLVFVLIGVGGGVGSFLIGRRL